MAAAVPFVLIAASTAVSVAGNIKQGKAEQKQAQYDASVSRKNEQIAQQDAVVAEQQATQQAGQVDRENRLRIGAIKAAVGASGVTLEGNALDVLGDTVAQGELDRQQVLYEGKLRSRGYKISAKGYADQAVNDIQRGKSARKASYWKAGASLLQGASSAYNSGAESGWWGSSGTKTGSGLTRT